MGRLLVDTNVLVAMFNERDSLHAKVEDVLPISATFTVLDIVLYETMTVLVQKVGHESAKQCLDFLLETEGVTLAATSAHRDMYMHEFTLAQSEKLSFIDIALLAHATEYTVVTFDKELQKEIAKKKRKRRA